MRLFFLLTIALNILCATADAAKPPLVITGPKQLDPTVAGDAAGPPQGTSVKAARRWAKEAASRIVAVYRKRGYSYVRAWTRVDRIKKRGKRTRQVKQIRIHVDEGAMQPVFVGASTIRSIFYRVDLYLPGAIFHRPTLRKALDELRDKYKLANAYFRVSKQKSLMRTPLGNVVHPRRLHIYLISRESRGFQLKVSLSTSWGILPKVAYGHPSLLFDDDRLSAAAELAVPYRRFIFEQDPEFQWVHSAAEVSYRLPWLFKRHFAPGLDSHTAVSRYVRSDPNVSSYFRYHVEGLGNLMFRFGPATFKLGAGVDYIRVFDLEQTAEATEPPPTNRAIRRYVTQLLSKLTFDKGLRRRDHRNEIALRVRVGIPSDGDDALVDSRAWARFVLHFREHDLLLRARGVLLAGRVHFWDEAELAGDYLRAHFDNRYWIHEAAQLTVAFRFAITYEIKVGIFHDLALFRDRSEDDQPAALANAWGPGLHLLLFDLFSFDLYYGFGFAPVGFSHSLSFKLHTAF